MCVFWGRDSGVSEQVLPFRLAQWAFIVYHVTPNGDSLLVDEEKDLFRRPIG